MEEQFLLSVFRQLTAVNETASNHTTYYCWSDDSAYNYETPCVYGPAVVLGAVAVAVIVGIIAYKKYCQVNVNADQLHQGLLAAAENNPQNGERTNNVVAGNGVAAAQEFRGDLEAQLQEDRAAKARIVGVLPDLRRLRETQGASAASAGGLFSVRAVAVQSNEERDVANGSANVVAVLSAPLEVVAVKASQERRHSFG